MARLELLDTSVLLELLLVPDHHQQSEEVQRLVTEKVAAGVRLQLPVAAVVEAGDHVGRIKDGNRRRDCALRLEQVLRASLAGHAPWSFTPARWDQELLAGLLIDAGTGQSALVDGLTRKHLEMGDQLILAELRQLRAAVDPRVLDIVVWTYDQDLAAAAAAQPMPPAWSPPPVR